MKYEGRKEIALRKIRNMLKQYKNEKTYGIPVEKIIGKDNFDILYAIDCILDNISRQPDRTLGESQLKIKPLATRKINIFRFIKESQNGKEFTICNVIDKKEYIDKYGKKHKYKDKFNNPVITLDEIVNEIIQMKIDDFKEDGKYSGINGNPDYEFVDSALNEEVDMIPEEDRGKYRILLAEGIRTGSIYRDCPALRRALRDKVRTEMIRMLEMIPEIYPKEQEELKKNMKKQEETTGRKEETLYICSEQGEQRARGHSQSTYGYTARVNEVIPFEDREKVFKDLKPIRTINIEDTNELGVNGICFIYENPQITNNGKKDEEKLQEQKGKLFIFEPLKGDRITKIFFAPYEELKEQKAIEEIIKERLEMPLDQFRSNEGTTTVEHTKLESFRDTINFYLTGKREKTLTYFRRSSERIKNLYLNEDLDVGYIPRRKSPEIADLAGGEKPDRVAMTQYEFIDYINEQLGKGDE